MEIGDTVEQAFLVNIPSMPYRIGYSNRVIILSNTSSEAGFLLLNGQLSAVAFTAGSVFYSTAKK